MRARRSRGAVFGSVIMKKKKTSTSGEVTRTHQNEKPWIGPRCQRAVIACPPSATRPMPTANAAQNESATRKSDNRRRIAKPALTMITSARAIHHDIGPHQKSSGSTRERPSARNTTTSPMLDGLKMCRPFHAITYFESSAPPAVATKIHQPCVVHQSPCRVPGTRRTNATPLPVSSALAGHIRTCCFQAVIDDLDRRDRAERDQDLRDRQLEVERDLPEHLQRGDGRREVEPRVAELRQHDRVGRAADRDGSHAARKCTAVVGELPLTHEADPCPSHRRPCGRPCPGARLRLRRRRPRGDRGRRDHGRRGARHPSERASEGVYRRPQRRTLDTGARARKARPPRASTRSSPSSSAAWPCSTATARSARWG